MSSGTLVRTPTTIISKSTVHLVAPANQRKLSDPGGGTFRYSITCQKTESAQNMS